MEKIIIFLKNTQGIFRSDTHSKNIIPFDMTYRSIREDKINMRNDMFTFASDFRKATDEAKKKYIHHD